MLLNTATIPVCLDYIMKDKVELIHNGILIIKNDSHCGRKIKECGKLEYDDLLTNTALELIPTYGTVIDCGAMYGSFTYPVQNKLSHEGVVVSIEPGRIALECLKHNCTSNFSHNIFMNCALSNNHKTWLRHKMTDDHGSSLVTDWDHTGENVMSMTIDGIVKDLSLDRVSFIKIKCQGWEYKILEGARKTLSEFMPVLMIEINHDELALHKDSFRKIEDILNRKWYSYKIIEPDKTEASPEFNIICQAESFDKRFKIIMPTLEELEKSFIEKLNNPIKPTQ